MCCDKIWGGIQKIALFGKRPSPYYVKNSTNKQRETTFHYFKKFSSMQSQKPSSAMMKLALMRTATGKKKNRVTSAAEDRFIVELLRRNHY